MRAGEDRDLDIRAAAAPVAVERRRVTRTTGEDRMRIRASIVAVVALVLLLAGCGDDDDDAGDGAGDGTTTTAAADDTAADDGDADGGQLDVAVQPDDELGEILVTGEGFTLYVFTPDGTSGEATCTGACASTWPPLVSNDGAPPAPLEAADFSTTDNEGSTQVVFMGRPLYRYSADANPGDTNGQGVGGQWFVVGPEGPIEE